MRKLLANISVHDGFGFSSDIHYKTYVTCQYYATGLCIKMNANSVF